MARLFSTSLITLLPAVAYSLKVKSDELRNASQHKPWPLKLQGSFLKVHCRDYPFSFLLGVS